MRWALRLALGTPMALFAGFATASAVADVPNDTLRARAALIEWGSSDLHWVGGVWPPLPVALAGLLGRSALALAVLGALCSGGLLAALCEQLVLRGQPRWLVALILVAVDATPAMAFLATRDLAQFLGLVLLLMAMSGFLRFCLYGRTEGGFRAGLLLGLATACDITAVVYALVLAAAGPLFAHRRYRDRPAAARATVAVLAFPAVAAAACWAYLEWRFTGGVFHVVAHSADFGFPGGVGPTAARAAGRVGLALGCAPLYLLAGAFLLRRSVVAALGYALPLPGLFLSQWVGLRSVTGFGVVLLSCLAVLALPRRTERPARALVAAAVVAQWGLTVALSLWWTPVLGTWWAQLAG